MFCGILADTLLCPLPSPPLLHAIDILDSFLGIWHLKNLFWLGGMWKDWNWVFQQQLGCLLVTQGKVQRWLDSLDANPQKLMALMCCHTSRGKKECTLSGDDSSCPREGTGRWTVDSKHLGAWKGPHLFGCIPSHLLHSEFLQGNGDGGKTTVPTCPEEGDGEALLGIVPEPIQASSLVLPLNLSAVGL